MHGAKGLAGSIAQLVHHSGLLAELSPASWRNSWPKPTSVDKVSQLSCSKDVQTSRAPESMVHCQPSVQQLTKQSQLMVHLTVLICTVNIHQSKQLTGIAA